MTCSTTCQDVYNIIAEMRKSNNEMSSNILFLHSLINDKLFTDLLCNKSPNDNPFIGTIQDETWLFRAIEANLASILSPEYFKSYVVSNKLKSSEFKNSAVKCIQHMHRHNDNLSPATPDPSKRYEKELEKWKAEGGDEALKAAKKQAKKEKRAAEASKSGEKKSKSSTPSAKLSSVGTGSHFKSKEYIESSDGSSN